MAEEKLTFRVERVFHVSLPKEGSTFATGLIAKQPGKKFAGGFVGDGPVVGQSYVAYGNWVEHPTYGTQFKCNGATLVPAPTAGKDLSKLLMLKLKGKGVGDLTIDLIVQAGKNELAALLDAQDTESLLARIVEHVAAIKGVAIVADSKEYAQLSKKVGGQYRKKVGILMEQWPEIRPKADLLSPLLSYGLSPAQAARAIELFGAKAVEQVEKEPYSLMLLVEGISFLRADAIARRVGVIPLNSAIRIRAAISFGLQNATSTGDVGVKRKTLLDRTMLLVNEAITEDGKRKLAPGIELLVKRPVLEEEIASMLNKDSATVVEDEDVCGFANNLVQTREATGDEVLWYRPLLLAEQRIADKLALLKAPARPDIVTAVKRGSVNGLTGLAPEQRDAVMSVFSSTISVITGGPGCGKTHVLKTILDVCQLYHVKVELTAPTGKAAKRMREATGCVARTIHSLVGFGSGGDKEIKADLLVIDESSMVDIEILDQALRCLPSTCRLLLVGDVDQLPSVGAGQVLRDLINSEQIPVTRLTRIFRQGAGSGIIQAAQLINSGVVPESSEDGQLEIRYTESPGIDLITELTAMKARGCNMEEVQILSPTHKGDAGCIALNKAAQQVCNVFARNGPKQQTVFMRRDSGNIFCGDRVLNGKNINEPGLVLVNGDLGMVDDLTEAGDLTLSLFGADKPVRLTSATSQNLNLAYAITVHKSQGAECHTILIALDRSATFMLTRNLLYTAVTRGVAKVIVFTSETVLNSAVRKGEPKEGNRRTSLREKVKLAFAAQARHAALVAARPVWDAPRVPAKWMPPGGLKADPSLATGPDYTQSAIALSFSDVPF